MLIYQYSGGLDGFLSAVFYTYEVRKIPDLITDGELTEPPLTAQTVQIEPEEQKALRVERGLCDRLGAAALSWLDYAYASCDPERNRKLLYWILSVFRYGEQVNKRFQDPYVMDFFDMTARVTLEIEHILGFLRFSQSAHGLFCAEFAPDHNILPFLMPHFCRRMNQCPFLIRDRKRKLYGLYNGKQWKIVQQERMDPITISEPELTFRALWRSYYNSASIPGRENKKLQNGYLPRRYRAYMTEFQTQT